MVITLFRSIQSILVVNQSVTLLVPPIHCFNACATSWFTITDVVELNIIHFRKCSEKICGCLLIGKHVGWLFCHFVAGLMACHMEYFHQTRTFWCGSTSL